MSADSDTAYGWNQPPEFTARDLWAEDTALREAVVREGAQAFSGQIAEYARLVGGTFPALAFDAHRDRPRLRTHDRFGERIDLVEFHPAWHQLMHTAIAHGVAGLSWQTSEPGAHVARAALCYLHNQAEPGTACPLTMTHAAVPVLRHAPHLQFWIDKITACQYDPRDLPAADKTGVTLGMGMTERQGGSDVHSNLTRALPGAMWFHGPGPGQKRADLLFDAAPPARWRAQSVPLAAAQGQARRLEQCLGGSRV